MAASLTTGRALRYAKGSARGLLHQALGHGLLPGEPFSSLEPERRHDIRRFVMTTIRDSAIPALLVTHDPQDARAAGGPVIALA